MRCPLSRAHFAIGRDAINPSVIKAHAATLRSCSKAVVTGGEFNTGTRVIGGWVRTVLPPLAIIHVTILTRASGREEKALADFGHD